LYIAAGSAVLALLIPDLFSICSCCGKVKTSWHIKFQKTRTQGLFATSRKSLCKKCSKRYNIDNMIQFEQLEKIKRKVEMELARSR
jgi:hypothetical protein